MSKTRFLAGLGFGIAVGTLFGFYALAPNVVGGPSGTHTGYQKDFAAEKDARARAEKEVDAADQAISSMSAAAVKGTLRGKSIAIIAFPGADPAQVSTLQGLIKQAGGANTTTIAFTPAALQTDSADKLKSIAANSLPAGATLSEDNLSPGTHVGQLLGAAIRTTSPTGGKTASDSDRAVVIGSLEKNGFIEPDSKPAPSDLALIITGDSSGDPTNGNYATNFVADFASGIDSATQGAVLAGSGGSASRDGAIGIIRNSRAYTENVSTVDNIERATGRLTALRALKQQAAGDAGQYGTGPNAARSILSR